MHDLGRTAIPNSIWDKPGPLTRAERDRVQLHPALTEKMLRRAGALDALNPVAACHHEKADGSGYFKGLTSHQLSPAERILGAADRYQAMTQRRAHRPPMSPEAAAAELRRMAAAADVDGDAAECVLAAMRAHHGDSERAEQLWENLQAIWSQAWSANYAVLEFMQNTGLTRFAAVKPQHWVVASFEHHTSPHGLPRPHVHNIVLTS